MKIKGFSHLQIQLPEFQLRPGESRPLFVEDPRIRG